MTASKLSMKKKLLIFIPSIEDGGVEKNLYILANFLYQKLNTLQIISTSYDKTNFFNKNINFIGPKFNFLLKKGRYIKYIICLIYLIKQIIINKRQVVIFSFQANIFAVLISKIFFIKIISRSNSSPSGWSQNIIKQKIFKFLLKKADTIIVNSKSFKNEFKKKFGINTIFIYNPFNDFFIKKKAKKKVSFNFFTKKSLNIISVGRLTDQKDHITLLRAFKFINKRLNPKLVIIGKGIEYNKLKIFIENNKINDSVKLFGYCPNPYPYIKLANIFVLTSKFEGLPNVLIESQFLKKYIISSNCPTGPKEILLNGKAGDLFPVGNFMKLAKLVNNFNKNKTLEKIQIGFKNLSRFNYKINCDKYLNVINKYL